MSTTTVSLPPLKNGTKTKPDARPWARRAACVSKTELFFEPPSERADARLVRELKASMVCAVCPVLVSCRAWAREHGEYGYWGGESEEARAAAGFRTRMPRAQRQPRRVDHDHVA
jgi:WhiB family redox-sensing transcriptional regulator